MKPKVREYEGDGIVVRFEPRRCIHAEECVHGLPGVFDAHRRPWVDPRGATADEIAAVVGRCPTGALQFERSDGGPGETPPPSNALTLVPNGPLYAWGDLELEIAGPGAPSREIRAALCRCGASERKPFCDNNHVELGFRDAGDLDAEGSGSTSNEPAEGPLKIRPLPNGSLLLDGRAELRSADGATRIPVRNAALCRCGASENKPFCDGSHFSVGFEAE
jgi:CDGSH-type Zn-finger protein/uncharacterized Fe-S cluster protein YjdI